jgi:nitrilase
MSATVAIVQSGALLFDTPGTLVRALERIAAAAAEGAQIVVFPEAFLGGYPKGMDFGARVGSRSPEGRHEFRRYFESAVDCLGPETHALAEAARTHGVYLVMGCVEREKSSLYCSVLFFSPDGKLMGRHRKVMPAAMERLIWSFGDGSTLSVFDTPYGRLGSVICWENYMPALRMAMYEQGIQIYCACTVDDRDTWVSTMRHIAVEGRCFVLSACQYVEGLIRGGSMIVDPLGRVIVEPVYGQETILTAEIDLRAIAEGKFDLDVVGHYARPDLFELRVQRAPQAPVTYLEGAGDDRED